MTDPKIRIVLDLLINPAQSNGSIECRRRKVVGQQTETGEDYDRWKTG